MKLSFVIPAYNEEKYIGRCLDSIHRELRGKDHDVEIIVVNNASTDRTHEVAMSFDGVKVVYEPQKGLVSARQAGYLASTGHLIANVDADTRLPKGWIDKVFSEFSRDEKLAALSGPYLYYDLSWWRLGLVKFFYYVGFLSHTFNHFIFRKGAMLQGGNFIVRRTYFKKAGEFNSQFDFYGEDTDVARRIQKVGKVKFTFSLPMYTSGRRLTKEGLLIAGTRYAINHFWVLFFKKPFTKTFKDVRN
jgi:glycosyltransferase involved in cell wall biosynthesis